MAGRKFRSESGIHFVLADILFEIPKRLCFATDMTSFDCLIGWQAHEGEVCSIQFSADETTAYSMGTDGKVRNIAWK